MTLDSIDVSLHQSTTRGGRTGELLNAERDTSRTCMIVVEAREYALAA
jgi:hypothetical protein